jgi:hypothetical protein
MNLNSSASLTIGPSAPPQRFPERLGRVQIVSTGSEGILLRVEDREHFLTFRKYPWFAWATSRELADVQMLAANHLYWPELDINVILRHHH